MPGSIHVSVADFSELPSSLPSSSILIKASMGKSDHQTWGKGDFSLPLTTLRDNVRITVHDAERNVLSQAGVRIISIVEKGYLDESLSLEGGGIVRLKFRFVLNDEERNKIQRMRESAMKRKRDELLSASSRYSKIAGAQSSYDNHEVSDSPASVAQNVVLKVGDQAIRPREGNEAHTKDIIANEANGGGISKGVQLLNNENHNRFGEKVETREQNSTRLVDSNDNEMNQIDVTNPYVTKDDSLDEKIETSVKDHGELVEKNVKEMPQMDAPYVISKDGSLSTAYLATAEASKVEEPFEKIPNNVIQAKKTDESEDVSSLFSISRRVHVCNENLNKANEKIKDGEEHQNRLEEKNEVKLDPISFPKIPIHTEDTSSSMKKDVAAFEVKKEVALQNEKREPLQKTSSSVRKMISAFESSLYKDMRPVIKPPPIKTQPEKVVLEAPKDLDSKDNIIPAKVFSSKVQTPLIDEKLKPTEIDGEKTEKRIDTSFSQDATHLEKLSILQTQVKETEERLKNNTKPTKPLSSEVKTTLLDEKSKAIETVGLKTEKCIGTELSLDTSCLEEPSITQTEVKETEEITKNEEDLVKTITVGELKQNHPLNLLVLEEGVCDIEDLGRPRSVVPLDNSHEVRMGKTMETETKTTCEFDSSSRESSSAWIFADEGSRVCITTEIKQVKDSTGSYIIEERLLQGFSLSENVEKDISKPKICTDVNKSGHIKSNNESLPGAETSSGPFGQAIKIAVMVAFGSLILFTRQRKPR